MQKEKRESLFHKIAKFNLRKLLRSPYYYVPPCPKCQSRITGRFMRRLTSSYETNWRIEESLKHGEIVANASDAKDGQCFCVSCGYIWNGIVSLKLWTLDRISEEKEARKTDTILDNMHEENPKNNKGGSLRKFIGHI